MSVDISIERPSLRTLVSRHIRRTAAYLADDAGVAGLIIAMLIMIVSFSALSVFLSKHSGPARELAKMQTIGGQNAVMKASLMVHFNQNGEVPCPDTNQDGDEDACTGGATSSGTLPWRTLGVSVDDAVDAFGTYYTYVVADSEKDFCVSVPNDYDDDADPEFTGEALPFDALEVIETTDGAVGANVPFAVISHGKNRLGGISRSGALITDPISASESANAAAAPTTIYTGPYDTSTDDYFDDTVWYPVTTDLESACQAKTPGGDLNYDFSEDFAGADGDVDQTKFDTATGGTEVQQEGGAAVFADATAYMTTVAATILNSSEGPLYISADWTPDSGATNAGFSIVTRAEATPTAGVFDPGIAFRFFDGTGASGANTISIMNDGAQVAAFTSADSTFTMTFGETYLLEVYDNGSAVWMQITQKNLVSNRAYAYATSVTGDTTGTRIALVNGAASESRIDNLVVGRPMLAMDTLGTGYAETSGNQNGTTTGSITLEGWFKPRSLPSGTDTATLISQWDVTQLNRSAFRLYMSSGGALSLSLGNGTVTTDTESLGVSLDTDEWTHVAVSYDDETTYGAIAVYINGALARSITGTVSSQILSGAAIRTAQEHFIVGANLSGTTGQNIFDGQVSDVRVWDDVRTEAEITEWYDHRLPIVDTDPALDNLRVNWRFDIESGGFSATQVEDRPAALGDDGDLVNGAVWVGALLNTYRATSTDVCNGFRAGAYRCDFRDAVSNLSIGGANLEGIATFYAKAWGGGGGADTAGGASAPYDGGGGGYAGGLFVNTGQNLTITVGAGGASGTSGVNGGNSFLDQGAQRVTGNRGIRGQNNNPGNSGIGAVTGALVTSVIDPTVASDNRRPGCVPAITVIGSPCTDEHYTTTGAPVAEPGYGADGPLADHATGQAGAVILFW